MPIDQMKHLHQQKCNLIRASKYLILFTRMHVHMVSVRQGRKFDSIPFQLLLLLWIFNFTEWFDNATWKFVELELILLNDWIKWQRTALYPTQLRVQSFIYLSIIH